MGGDWHQTEQIVMAVQTAELRQAGVNHAPELHLSCNLVSIARGQCLLTLVESDTAAGTQIGSLVIEVDRPMMRGAAGIPTALFTSICERVAATPPRPVSLTLDLDTQLAVSIKGDLRIDAEKTIGIQDMAVNLPLK